MNLVKRSRGSALAQLFRTEQSAKTVNARGGLPANVSSEEVFTDDPEATLRLFTSNSETSAEGANGFPRLMTAIMKRT